MRAAVVPTPEPDDTAPFTGPGGCPALEALLRDHFSAEELWTFRMSLEPPPDLLPW